jgi:hypothetical protein
MSKSACRFVGDFTGISWYVTSKKFGLPIGLDGQCMGVVRVARGRQA